MPSQWEFQVGPTEGIDMGDDLWVSRFHSSKTHQIVSDGPSKIFNSCFQVHSPKGGRRLWSGCHFWSQGEGQIKLAWKLLCYDSQSESKFDNFFQRSRWWATGMELVLTQTSPLSLWGTFDIWVDEVHLANIFEGKWKYKEETNIQNTISGLPAESKQSRLLLRSSPSKHSDIFSSNSKPLNALNTGTMWGTSRHMIPKRERFVLKW